MPVNVSDKRLGERSRGPDLLRSGEARTTRSSHRKGRPAARASRVSADEARCGMSR